MSFNVSALDTFRNVNLGGENAIANLGQGDKVVKKNDYHGAIGAMFRGKEMTLDFRPEVPVVADVKLSQTFEA